MLNLIVINVDFGKFLKVISNVTILFQKKFTDTIDNNYFFLLSTSLSPNQQLTSCTVQEEGSQQV